MGRGNKRYFGDGQSRNQKSSGSLKKWNKGDFGGSSSGADPRSREFYYDAVDDFHDQRDKVYLDRVGARKPQVADEEVYRIRSDSDDDEDEMEEQEEVETDNESDDMESDISGNEEGEEHLLSADAWGKRRKVFYSTDFIGDDRAGLSGSDEEAAELEEQEAISLQKRLVQQMTEDDFKLDRIDSAKTSKATLEVVATESKDLVQADLSELTEEEKLELLQQQSPELLALIDEYQTKSEIVKKYLEPVAKSLLEFEKQNYDIDGRLKMVHFDWITKKFELYMNFLLNIQFYFVLKIMRQPIDNHPVIDRITSLKKLVNEMDDTYGHMDKNLKQLSKILKSGSSLADVLDLFDMNVKKSRTSTKIIDSEKKKRVHWQEPEADQKQERKDMDEQFEPNDAVEKRGVTYEIERNKGVTPSRKKEQRNPRVKNRMRFKKAVHKKKSQLPDARKELQKYCGEIRGIKANLVRSVKLH